MSGSGSFRHRVLEIDPGLVRLEGFARLRRDPTFFWDEPAADRLLAGFGAAWRYEAAAGPSRIVASAAAASGLFDRVDLARGSDGPEPVVVGGFSFSDRPSAGAPDDGPGWDEFPPGLLILPEITIRRSNGRAWVGVTVDDALPSGTARAAAEGVVADLTGGSAGPTPSHRTGTAVAANGDEAFRSLVKRAVAEVESGKLAKVVAARAATVAAEADPWRVLGALRSRYPSCAVYGLFRTRTVFVGASPELLVALHDGRVSAHALAGTVDRGDDDVADARLEDRLRHDPKELAEHQYVVQGLRRALYESGVSLDPPAALEIVKLANVQHLASPVGGTASPGTGVLDLVNAVHPTPAVAGLPRTAALRWLEDNENLDRGWYAGPIGWMNASKEGAFRVALRCALLTDGRARLFAGAGIVAGSRPERELAETSAKLAAMLGALESG